MDTNKLQERIREFAKERDWDQYHTPKNLVMALSGEAGELTEIFQWVSEQDSHKLLDEEKTRTEIMDEIADVQIYLLRLCDVLGVDLEKACWVKMDKNNRKYPADLVKGSSKKYTEYKKQNANWDS